jgi:hypothetical protein
MSKLQRAPSIFAKFKVVKYASGQTYVTQSTIISINEYDLSAHRTVFHYPKHFTTPGIGETEEDEELFDDRNSTETEKLSVNVQIERVGKNIRTTLAGCKNIYVFSERDRTLITEFLPPNNNCKVLIVK